MRKLPSPPKYIIGDEPAPLSAELCDLLERCETTMLGHILYWGGLDPSIQCISGQPKRVVGRALTVEIPGSCSTMLHHAIGLAKSGDVLVIDRRGDTQYACLGGGVARAAMKQGIVGAIIDGPCTDKQELATMGFPVWSRGVSQITTRLANLGGRSRVTISCGGVAVSSGDAVLADENGVYILPPDDALHLAGIAEKRAQIVRQTKRPAGATLGEMSGATAMVSEGLVER